MKVSKRHHTRILKNTQYHNHRLAKHSQIKYVLTWHDMYRYNAFNVYRRELAPGTVSLTGDRAQGDDSKHWANSRNKDNIIPLIQRKGPVY